MQSPTELPSPFSVPMSARAVRDTMPRGLVHTETVVLEKGQDTAAPHVETISTQVDDETRLRWVGPGNGQPSAARHSDARWRFKPACAPRPGDRAARGRPAGPPAHPPARLAVGPCPSLPHPPPPPLARAPHNHAPHPPTHPACLPPTLTLRSQLGYKQELRRELSLLKNFAVSFGLLSMLTGLGGYYAFGFTYGEPGGQAAGCSVWCRLGAQGAACGAGHGCREQRAGCRAGQGLTQATRAGAPWPQRPAAAASHAPCCHLSCCPPAGGPVVVVWGWVLIVSMTLTIATSMAEICSSLPTTGGVYYCEGSSSAAPGGVGEARVCVGRGPVAVVVVCDGRSRRSADHRRRPQL